MGQCETCTSQMEYNLIDCDLILKEISETDLAKDIQKLRKDNEEYIKPFKTVPMAINAYFKGKVVDNKKEGYGELYCQDFNFYGFFKNDLPHGTGALITEKQCQFGQFHEGNMHGEGKEWTIKLRFEGKYQSGHRVEGNLYREELTYTGSFKGDLFDGKGALNLKDGTSYIGFFKQGKFDDKGVLTFPNSNSYRGGFKNGKYEGYGQFLWKNGNHYKGEYADGERQGYGVLLIDGIEYAGQWKRGVREGRGFLTHNSDQVFADWRNDMLVEK